MGMLEDTHGDYDWYQFMTEPADFGFTATSRKRTYVIGSHVDRSSCLADPFTLFEDIKGAFDEQNIKTEVKDYCVASKEEILMETSLLAQHRGLTHYQPGNMALEYLLTKREAQTISALNTKYFERFGELAESNANLTYFLGDSADYCCWSAVSGKLPTFRMNAKTGKFWMPALSRWLTAKERLCSLGFPVTVEQAHALNVPILGATDVQRAADICGNCMHLQTVGIFQLIALACFGPL